MNSVEELSTVVADIFNNKRKYIDYGKNAKSFYDNNRTPQHMAAGLWRAIQYVLNK